MKKQRIFRWILAYAMIFSLFCTNFHSIPNVSATETTATEEDEEDDDTEPEAIPGVITNATAVYDEEAATITISYTKTGCQYVDIDISAGDIEPTMIEEYDQNSYIYPVMNFGVTYTITITPYDNAETPEPVEEAAVQVTCMVLDNDALLKAIQATYDTDTHTLLINWIGTDIATVDIFQDEKKLATVTKGNSYSTNVKLEEAKTYDYTVVAYTADSKECQSRTYKLTVERYSASISNVTAEYNTEKKQIEITWDSEYTVAVDLLLNDEVIVKSYNKSQYIIPYRLQPGAQYTISIIPYNIKGKEGNTVTTTVSDGEFVTPDAPDLELQCEPIKKNGTVTGFYKPAIDVIVDVQPGAVYEIYRAISDKKSAYTWIATFTAGEEETYTYRDTKIEVNTYYYKVLRKIKEDDYIFNETNTALSESSEIDVEIPDTSITGQLSENGNISIFLESDSNLVSGYEIYRKANSGKYILLTTISGNSYEDANIAFDTKYSYKARAYYYDTKTKKKSYGSYSSVFSVRNTIGAISIDVTPLSGNQVKISWTKAGNAAGYEVYYKTDTIGDSYERLTSTKKLSIKKKLKSKEKYFFLVRAYRQNSKGKTYFSEAEITYKTDFATPRGLAITKTNHNVVQGTIIQTTGLQWNQVYNAQGYYIEALDKTTGQYTLVKRFKGGNKTSCTVTDILPTSTSLQDEPTVISYRVVAYKGKKKLASEPLEVPLRIDTPEKVKIKGKSGGSKAAISWKKVQAAEKYHVYRSCGRDKVLIGETTNNSFTDSDLEIGVVYTYYIQAVNQTLHHASDYSEPLTYTYTPNAVKKLRATNTAGRSVVLKWNKVSNVDSYTIYYSTQRNGTYQKLDTVASNITKYTHKGLVRWRTYYYKIVTTKNNTSGACAESKAAKASVTVAR